MKYIRNNANSVTIRDCKVLLLNVNALWKQVLVIAQDKWILSAYLVKLAFLDHPCRLKCILISVALKHNPKCTISVHKINFNNCKKFTSYTKCVLFHSEIKLEINIRMIIGNHNILMRNKTHRTKKKLQLNWIKVYCWDVNLYIFLTYTPSIINLSNSLLEYIVLSSLV